MVFWYVRKQTSASASSKLSILVLVPVRNVWGEVSTPIYHCIQEGEKECLDNYRATINLYFDINNGQYKILIKYTNKISMKCKNEINCKNKDVVISLVATSWDLSLSKMYEYFVFRLGTWCNNFSFCESFVEITTVSTNNSIKSFYFYFIYLSIMLVDRHICSWKFCQKKWKLITLTARS